MHPDEQTEPDAQGAQTETGRGVGVREAARLLNTTVEGERGGGDRRRSWFSLGHVLGIAVLIVLIIWLILLILPDPLGSS